jgi:hypothetical protein
MPQTPTVQVRFGNPSLTEAECFFFEGMPTPYVSRNQEIVYYGQKSHAVTTIQLNGTIIGTKANTDIINNEPPGYGQNLNTLSLDLDRKQILSGFGRYDHGKLAIYENGTSYKTFENCIVKDINFTPVAYGKQDYTITLTCFEAASFKTMFGVVDPANNISFNENEDGTVSITQSVSAKGFTTASKTAIEYAEDFVDATTGIQANQIAPSFISSGNLTQAKTYYDENFILQSISKDVNRVDGTCSANLEFTWQNEAVENIYISGVQSTVSTNISSGIQSEFLTVDVTYKIKGSQYHPENTLPSFTPTTGSLYQIASGALDDSSIVLNQIPLSLSVEDNSKTSKTINVEASYDNNLFPDYFQKLGFNVFFDYSVDMSTDDVRDISSLSVNGQLKGRGPNRYDHLTGFYEDYIIKGNGAINEFLYFRANEFYTGIALNQLYGTKDVWPLNRQPENVSIKLDPIGQVIDINGSFNNKDFPQSVSLFSPPVTGYMDFSYKLGVEPALNQFKATPSISNGVYGVYNLNVSNREKLSVDIDANANLYNNSSPASQPVYKSQIQAYNYALRTGFLGLKDQFGGLGGGGVGGTGIAPINGNLISELMTDDEQVTINPLGNQVSPLTQISSKAGYSYTNFTDFV